MDNDNDKYSKLLSRADTLHDFNDTSRCVLIGRDNQIFNEQILNSNDIIGEDLKHQFIESDNSELLDFVINPTSIGNNTNYEESISFFMSQNNLNINGLDVEYLNYEDYDKNRKDFLQNLKNSSNIILQIEDFTKEQLKDIITTFYGTQKIGFMIDDNNVDTIKSLFDNIEDDNKMTKFYYINTISSNWDKSFKSSKSRLDSDIIYYNNDNPFHNIRIGNTYNVDIDFRINNAQKEFLKESKNNNFNEVIIKNCNDDIVSYTDFDLKNNKLKCSINNICKFITSYIDKPKQEVLKIIKKFLFTSKNTNFSESIDFYNLIKNSYTNNKQLNEINTTYDVKRSMDYGQKEIIEFFTKTFKKDNNFLLSVYNSDFVSKLKKRKDSNNFELISKHMKRYRDLELKDIEEYINDKVFIIEPSDLDKYCLITTDKMLYIKNSLSNIPCIYTNSFDNKVILHKHIDFNDKDIFLFNLNNTLSGIDNLKEDLINIDKSRKTINTNIDKSLEDINNKINIFNNNFLKYKQIFWNQNVAKSNKEQFKFIESSFDIVKVVIKYSLICYKEYLEYLKIDKIFKIDIDELDKTKEDISNTKNGLISKSNTVLNIDETVRDDTINYFKSIKREVEKYYDYRKKYKFFINNQGIIEDNYIKKYPIFIRDRRNENIKQELDELYKIEDIYESDFIEESFIKQNFMIDYSFDKKLEYLNDVYSKFFNKIIDSTRMPIETEQNFTNEDLFTFINNKLSKNKKIISPRISLAFSSISLDDLSSIFVSELNDFISQYYQKLIKSLNEIESTSVEKFKEEFKKFKVDVNKKFIQKSKNIVPRFITKHNKENEINEEQDENDNQSVKTFSDESSVNVIINEIIIPSTLINYDILKNSKFYLQDLYDIVDNIHRFTYKYKINIPEIILKNNIHIDTSFTVLEKAFKKFMFKDKELYFKLLTYRKHISDNLIELYIYELFRDTYFQLKNKVIDKQILRDFEFLYIDTMKRFSHIIEDENCFLIFEKKEKSQKGGSLRHLRNFPLKRKVRKILGLYHRKYYKNYYDTYYKKN